MTTQTFTVAGITTNGGNAKVRFTDDMVRRIKQFTKGGHERIDFVELPNAMNKIEALKYLQTHPEFQSASDQATIQDALTDRIKESSKGEVKVKAEKSKMSVESIKARAKKAAVTPEEILAVTEHITDPV